MTQPRTLFAKIWDRHVVTQERDAPAILYIDLHLVHEVTSPQAFAGLRERGLEVMQVGCDPKRDSTRSLTGGRMIPTVLETLRDLVRVGRDQSAITLEEIVFTGLESARRDWTALAKDFQHELLERVFHDEPVDGFIRAFVGQVRDGPCDRLRAVGGFQRKMLRDRKRLSRDLDDVTKAVPGTPDCQAVRTLLAFLVTLGVCVSVGIDSTYRPLAQSAELELTVALCGTTDPSDQAKSTSVPATMT